MIDQSMAEAALGLGDGFKSGITKALIQNNSGLAREFAIIDPATQKRTSVAYLKNGESLQGGINRIKTAYANQGSGVTLNAYYAIGQAISETYRKNTGFYSDLAMMPTDATITLGETAYTENTASEMSDAQQQTEITEFSGFETASFKQRSVLVPVTYKPFELNLTNIESSQVLQSTISNGVYSVFKTLSDMYANGSNLSIDIGNGGSRPIYGLTTVTGGRSVNAALGADPYNVILDEIGALDAYAESGIMAKSLYIYYSSNLSARFNKNYIVGEQTSPLRQQLTLHEKVAENGVKVDPFLPDSTICIVEMEMRTVKHVYGGSNAIQTLPIPNNGAGANQWLSRKWVSAAKHSPLFIQDASSKIAVSKINVTD